MKKQTLKLRYKVLVILITILTIPIFANAQYLDTTENSTGVSNEGTLITTVNGAGFFLKELTTSYTDIKSLDIAISRFSSTGTEALTFEVYEWASTSPNSYSTLIYESEEMELELYEDTNWFYQCSGSLPVPEFCYKTFDFPEGIQLNAGNEYFFLLTYSGTSTGIYIRGANNTQYAPNPNYNGELNTCSSGTCTNYRPTKHGWIKFGTTTSQSYIVSSTTEILGVTPTPDSLGNATSTSFEIGAVGYVIDDDLTANTELKISVLQYTSSTVDDPDTFPFSANYTFPILVQGAFDKSNTAIVLNQGWYLASAEIRKPRVSVFGYVLLWNTLDNVSWAFEVATSSEEEKENAQFSMSLQTLGQGQNASTTLSNTTFGCNIISNFSLGPCVHTLFVPTSAGLANSLNSLRDGYLRSFPVGYLTRFVEIVSGNSTTTVLLPVITGTIFVNTDHQQALSFDLDDFMVGGMEKLDNIEDPLYSKNPQDVFQPMIRVMIALIVLFIIITDVMRLRQNFNLERQ